MTRTKKKSPGKKMSSAEKKTRAVAEKSKKRTAEDAEEYDSDGGFVVDEDGEEGPKAKKVKSNHTKAASKAGGSGRGTKEVEIPGDGGVDDQGSEFWELSGKRRVTVSEYPKGKGKYVINIREYYEKDNQMLPGKKGILMPMEQFVTLIETLPHIEAVLKGKGVDLPRPNYQDVAAESVADDGNESTEEQVKDEIVEGGIDNSKKNFEATSEEEGDAEND